MNAQTESLVQQNGRLATVARVMESQCALWKQKCYDARRKNEELKRELEALKMKVPRVGTETDVSIGSESVTESGR